LNAASPSSTQAVTVRILDQDGQETFHYQTRLVEKAGNRIVLEGYFNRQDTPVGELVFANGDRFLETFYTDRWYNILEVHDRADDRLKGWYCNLCFPAVFQPGDLSYRDLELDLLIYPDGRQVLLDEDEYARLELAGETREQVKAALRELQARFHEKLAG
jgi:predicted RNA-binding protein associated with RNAse of E/G family